jgi:hypothetical protein
MLTNRSKAPVDDVMAFDRGMLRHAFVSLFWAIISDRRQRAPFPLQAIADRLGIDKSGVSRWFGRDPNWRVNTIADVAHVLDVEIRITARDRKTGVVYAPHGREHPVYTSAAADHPAKVIELHPSPSPTDARATGSPEGFGGSFPLAEVA